MHPKIVFENVRLSGLTKRFNNANPRKGDVVVRLKNDDAELSIQSTESDAPMLGQGEVYRLTLEKVG